VLAMSSYGGLTSGTLPMNPFGSPGNTSMRQASGPVQGGGMGAVNYEMLQSFMQRNAEGSGQNIKPP